MKKVGLVLKSFQTEIKLKKVQNALFNFYQCRRTVAKKRAHLLLIKKICFNAAELLKRFYIKQPVINLEVIASSNFPGLLPKPY